MTKLRVETSFIHVYESEVMWIPTVWLYDTCMYSNIILPNQKRFRVIGCQQGVKWQGYNDTSKVRSSLQRTFSKELSPKINDLESSNTKLNFIFYFKKCRMHGIWWIIKWDTHKEEPRKDERISLNWFCLKCRRNIKTICDHPLIYLHQNQVQGHTAWIVD